jgi:hypothetical protein
MMGRASSGLRSSINSIEPLMSAKRAVTVLRSPSVTSEAVCSAESAMSDVPEEYASDCAVPFLAASAVPQSPQKLLPGGFSRNLPQRRHVEAASASRVRAAPDS